SSHGGVVIRIVIRIQGQKRRRGHWAVGTVTAGQRTVPATLWGWQFPRSFRSPGSVVGCAQGREEVCQLATSPRRRRTAPLCGLCSGRQGSASQTVQCSTWNIERRGEKRWERKGGEKRC